MKKRNRAAVWIMACLMACLAILPASWQLQAEQPEGSLLAGMEKLVMNVRKQALLSVASKRAEKLNAALASQIENYMAEKSVDRDLIGIEVESLDGIFHYSLNGDEEFIAASLYKAPLAVVYYDKINEGEYVPEDSLYYGAYMYEEGGPIGSSYGYGAQIELQELLHDMIIYSDNTAGHILYETLGGWVEYKQAIEYLASDHTGNPGYLTYENLTTPAFMNDVMLHIARNPGQYEILIEDMKASQPERYLNNKKKMDLPQKYGEISGVENAAGFCLDTYPYAITIMTANWQGETWIGEISEIVHEFFEAIP